MYLGDKKKLLDLIFIPVLNMLPVFQKGGVHLSVVENRQYSMYGVKKFYILTNYQLTPEMLTVIKFLNENCSSQIGGVVMRYVISRFLSSHITFVSAVGSCEGVPYHSKQKRPGLHVALETLTLILGFCKLKSQM